MRQLYFLVPGTTGKFGGGGLWAELKTCALAKQICLAEIVTYRQREQDYPFLSDLLPNTQPNSAIFIIGWGFDVPKIVAQLKEQNIVYHAHSSNYGFELDSDIPIITVSRNTMGYWGEKAANALVYYLPNQISDEFSNLNQQRDIDVVVQTRKSSEYLLKQLIPALQSRYQVEVIDNYVADLAGLFNRSKIYLYDSAEYWATSGVTEGFGLPPLEALACGCTVFSSVNHGLADFLDPGFNCYKIASFSLDYDLHRIAQVLQQTSSIQSSRQQLTAALLNEYRQPNLVTRLGQILLEINDFFDWQQQRQNQDCRQIKSLNSRRIQQLKIQIIMQKILTKLGVKFNRN